LKTKTAAYEAYKAVRAAHSLTITSDHHCRFKCRWKTEHYNKIFSALPVKKTTAGKSLLKPGCAGA